MAAIARRSDRSSKQEQLDFFTLQNVLLLSLLTIAFALLPNLLERQLEAATTAWRVSAGVYIGAIGTYVAFTLNLFPGVYREVGRKIPNSFLMNAVLLILGLLTQALIAFGAAPPSAYLLSLASLLYCAGFGFGQ